MLLEKNKDIELAITGMTAEGGGVGHYKGMAVFVAGAAAGDHVLVHIIKVKKNYAIGKIIDIPRPSPHRRENDCPVFPRCGGCALRHITYEEELRVKSRRVEDCMRRIGRIDRPPEPIISNKRQDRYRNKAQYPVGADSSGILTGFYAQRSHRIIPCEDCLLQPSIFSHVLAAFRFWMETHRIQPYDETSRTGHLRHIYIRLGEMTGQVLVCPVCGGDSLPHRESLLRMLRERIPGLAGLVINYNTADTNVILGDRYELVWGKDFVEDIICGLRFKISVPAFYQVNRAGAELLYQKAAEYAALSPADTLLDLYCGSGLIGLTMAGRVKRVIGVEIVPEAVEDAKQNAVQNNIVNAEFICGDAADAAESLRERGVCPGTVVVDPPRKGCGGDLVKTIAGMNPKRVVYISCDPATLARDCGYFHALGYGVMKYTPVGMFPRTAHVETVCLLVKQ